MDNEGKLERIKEEVNGAIRRRRCELHSMVEMVAKTAATALEMIDKHELEAEDAAATIAGPNKIGELVGEIRALDSARCNIKSITEAE